MRSKSRHKQRGWIPLVVAAISAAAAAKASADARRNRLGAQSQAALGSDEEFQRQMLFAQNQIQWRVADAKKAGIHPLYALQGGMAGYTPSAQQVFPYDPSPTLALGNSLGRLGGAVADYYSGRANANSGELMGPPDNLAPDDVAYSLPVSSYPETVGFPLAPQGGPAPAPYGMTSAYDKPSMAFWSVPELGRVIAPDASNFSESLEGLESPIGQGLILYLNRDLGTQALKWLWGQMPRIPELVSRGLDYAIDLGRSAAEKHLGVQIRRD